MPLYLILAPYALFILVFVVFTLVDMANLWRYRSGFFSASFITLVFLAGTLAILFGTYFFLSPIDWTQTINMNFSFTVPTL